tara:strand:- start:67 stop:195 length:129 start_codon:yes stop_codon:yes gene_type:complete
MIKKIILSLLLCCLVFSCGKKGNPVYEDPENKVSNYILLNKA